jgi:predicted ATPase
VGRGPELGRLRAAFTEAMAGRRRTVLVAGETGIGKTRLGAELAALAAADGATVLAGRCDQYPGVPYLPLREALGRHLAAAPAERLRALRGPEAAELARRWPELAWRLPTAPAPPRADPRADRYLLFEAVSGLLEAVAAGGPLLLLVDDLQGADAASLLLLRSLAHAPRPARLLTVLLYRDDELPARASLAVALGDLLRAPGTELLNLGGLATGDVAALAGAAAGRPLTAAEAELAGALRARTRGNPFLVDALLAAGGVDRAVRDVPDSVRWVVGQRLAGLGGAVEYVLGAAAVLGHQFDLALLGQVVDLGHDSLLSTLDKAAAARLVEERAGAPGRYAFHHPLVRDVLYLGLPAGERARAQRRVEAGRAAGGPGL